MFCSRCGKTLSQEWTECRHCGEKVGSDRFNGAYTSSQPVIMPGDKAEPYEARVYTRTSYTGGDYEEQYDGEVDVATSYRPVYDFHSAPDEDTRNEMFEAVGRVPQEDAENAEENGQEFSEPFEDAEAAAEKTEEAEDISDETIDINDIEGFDMSKIKARPIVARKPAGYSSEMEEYVRKLETEEPRPNRRGRHLAKDDEYVPEDEDETVAAAPVDADIPEDEDTDDEYYEDDEPRRFNASGIIKIVVALVVVAALFVGGVYIAPKLFGSFKEEATVKIEGVTPELYNAGIKLVDERMTQEYRDGVMNTYKNGGFVALTTRLDSDQAEIDALLPENPSINDQLFLDAISKIQDDIGGAITMDAVEQQNNGSVTSEDSKQRWASIGETVNGFKSVNNATGLTSIVNGERIEAVINTPTPEPLTTPAPQYTTLSKGDDSEDVRKMQQRLYDIGYLNDTADGKFGNNTQTAVKLFQQEAGLTVTGIADNETLVLLYSDDAPWTDNAKITPTPEPTTAPLQPSEVQ